MMRQRNWWRIWCNVCSLVHLIMSAVSDWHSGMMTGALVFAVLALQRSTE